MRRVVRAQIDKGASGITSANVATLIGQGHHVASHNIYNYKHQTLYGTGNGESNGTGTSQALAAYIADYNTARATLEAAGVDPAGLMYHPYVQGGADTGTVLAMQASGVDIAPLASYLIWAVTGGLAAALFGISWAIRSIERVRGS